jgi:hypothetical protein
MLLVNDFDRMVDPGHLLQHVVIVVRCEVGRFGRLAERRDHFLLVRIRLSSENVFDENLLNGFLPNKIVPQTFDRTQSVALYTVTMTKINKYK